MNPAAVCPNDVAEGMRRRTAPAGRLPSLHFLALTLATFFGAAPACMPKDPTLGNGGGTGGVAASGGAPAGSGGATSTGGAAGATSPDAGMATGGAGGGGGAGGTVALCNPSPAPRVTTGTILEIPVDIIFDGKPFVFGETNAVSSTATVLPLNFRFFLSAIELLKTGGGSVPVDIVTATGTLQPYGVFFYNAEDAATQTLRVRAPAGTYTGLKIELGIGVACNTGLAAGREFPLSSDSQMSWPHVAGYLFLRFEGQLATTDETARASFPPAVHLGGDIKNLSVPGALVFRIEGPLSIPASGSSAGRRLRLAMDQVFKGAASAVDVSDLPFPFSTLPEVIAGERLRRTGADLPLFILGP